MLTIAISLNFFLPVLEDSQKLSIWSKNFAEKRKPLHLRYYRKYQINCKDLAVPPPANLSDFPRVTPRFKQTNFSHIAAYLFAVK